MSRRSLAAALVVSAALLGACSPMPGTAAVVDGARITERHVTDASATFTQLLGSAPNTAAIVDALVKEKVITPVAADFGLTASDAQVVEYFGEYTASTGAEPLPESEFTPAGLQVGRYLYLMGEAQMSEDVQEISVSMLEAFQTADIEVSARYGGYNENGELLPTAHPWLETFTAER
ncbi:MAG: hypothetical protein EOL91_09960 [Actinobacteria bacterium]|nr:hypothetical protein [Actinomycetota bacterium]